MSKLSKRIIFRTYTIADFEKEEIFLREQHNKGYKFVKYILPGFYMFEKCTPEDVVYKLDFSDIEEHEKEGYTKLFSDCGWEYIFDVVGWSYFRKPYNVEDSNMEIFSDMDSNINLFDRVKKKRIIPLVAMFLLILIPQLFKYIGYWMKDEAFSSDFHKFMFFFFVIMFIAYLYMFIKFQVSVYRLKRKYRNINS